MIEPSPCPAVVRHRWFLGTLLAALLAGAVWLRCEGLGTIPGLNGDEAWYGAQAVEMLEGQPLQWQTPPGNPLNLLFFLPIVLVHVVLSPSVAVLRLVPLANGLLALAVNWWLCRRVFDRPTAWASTLILAVLPINIAYSRFAWDASQSVLAALPVVYCSLAAVRFPKRFDRWFAAAIVAQLAAVWIHPTNILTGVAIAIALIVRIVNWWVAGGIYNRRALFRWATVAGLALATVAVWAGNVARTQGSSRLAGRWSAMEAALHGDALAESAVLYSRFFTGETAYQYLAGSHSWLHSGEGLASTDVLAWWAILLASAGVVLVSSRRIERSDAGTAPPPDFPLVASWLLELAAFALLAGSIALVPGQERYAMCLVVPAVVLVARGGVVTATQWPALGPWLTVTACLVGGLLLADFQVHYFRAIRSTGGNAHATFRTAAVEPKQAAVDWIRSEKRSGLQWVLASEWWIHEPLRYLASRDADIRVLSPDQAATLDGFDAALAEGRLWQVEFADSAGLEWARRQRAGRIQQEHVVVDSAGRPAVVVLRFGQADRALAP